MPSAIATRGLLATGISGLRAPGLHLIMAGIFALHFLLNLAALFPRFYQINPLDGMYFILTGRLLANSISERWFFFPEFHHNPLVIASYALIYAPFHKHVFWLVI